MDYAALHVYVESVLSVSCTCVKVKPLSYTAYPAHTSSHNQMNPVNMSVGSGNEHYIHQNGGKSDFDHGMVVDFTHKSLKFTQNGATEKNSSEQQFCWWIRLAERHRRRLAELFRADCSVVLCIQVRNSGRENLNSSPLLMLTSAETSRSWLSLWNCR